MTPDERIQHTQQTFIALGDEYLVQYFLCAHRGFRGSQILSRLFSMGHSLELYAKAVLVTPDGFPPTGHDLPDLLRRCDPSLILSEEELEAGKALFGPDINEIDGGLWIKHEEAMELYQAQYFLVNLKYYLSKDNKVIFPARKSLVQINIRYLGIVKALRLAINNRVEHHDKELVNLVNQLGFAENPALAVVS